MQCIQLHCHFLPLHSKLIHRQKVEINKKLLWLSTHESTNKVALHSQNISSSHQQWRTKSISDSLVLGLTTSPPKPDISVLIQTGAVLIFFYGIANFVVPYFVSKSLGLDEDEKLEDETGKATSNTETSETQKQDLDKTKV
ncbi:uncharacterized protein LOC119990076 [Tripterygium wilfordii]|uniref:uncharacterized protein LOC119990076 n=1 Tax=Tripterygium wilfordii TaxID=458696 RepID=UPI0018F7F08E|nr:uncharacterized protein LOC119990076 [Tripterygium wilfordii]